MRDETSVAYCNKNNCKLQSVKRLRYLPASLLKLLLLQETSHHYSQSQITQVIQWTNQNSQQKNVTDNVANARVCMCVTNGFVFASDWIGMKN